MSKMIETEVWDLSIRVFHWVLVIAIGFSWLSAELGGNMMVWHTRSGYLVAGMVVFRLFWGFGGTWSARFGSFLRGPKAVINYLRGQGEEHFLTHNPAGGWSAAVLLALVTVQVGTGLFSNDDIFITGPLADLVSYDAQLQLTDIHKLNFNLLLTVITIHILAVFYHQRIKGDRIIQAMIHGKKLIPDDKKRSMVFPKSAFLISLSVSGFITYLLWTNG